MRVTLWGCFNEEGVVKPRGRSESFWAKARGSFADTSGLDLEASIESRGFRNGGQHVVTLRNRFRQVGSGWRHEGIENWAKGFGL